MLETSILNAQIEEDRYISHSNFENELLIGVDISRIEFESVQFTKCEFENCDFTKASFYNTHFINCNFSNCIFTESYWKNAEILSCKGDGGNFSHRPNRIF